MKTGVPLRVVLASLVAIATTLPTLAKAEGPREDDVLPGRVRRLPPLWLIPADASSRRVADEMARALALVGLYEPVIGQPGEVVPGPSVGVKASQSTKSGATIVDTSVEEEKDGHPARRRVEINPSKQAMDLARLTDGVLLDVSGERSHLSGRISFTYDAAPGHSLRCQALATGQAESTPSPLEKLSPGSFVGPSDRPAITSVRVGPSTPTCEEFLQANPSADTPNLPPPSAVPTRRRELDSSSCNRGNQRRFVYAAADGWIWMSDQHGSTLQVVRGANPICSPDGRTILFSRSGSQGGLYVVGAGGGAPTQLWNAPVKNLRWTAGRQLPADTESEVR